MKKIDAIIFDLNGIFIESTPLTLQMVEKFNVDKDQFLNTLKSVLKEARTPGEKPDSLWNPITEVLKINKQEFFNLWFSSEKINFEMLGYVKELKTKGLKLFILSNNFKDRTEYYRQKFPELLNAFDDIYFSYETGFVKPDPKAWENILNINKTNPINCIYFDDSPDNVEAAKTLGINAQLFENVESCRKFITENIS